MLWNASSLGLGRMGFAVAGFLLMVGLPASGLAQSAGVDQLEKRLSELEAGQRKILETLERLEARIDHSGGDDANSSSVTVRIRSQAGEPLAGYEAHLMLEANQGRTIQARGTSDADGLALERRMPYGRYRLSLSQNGWTALVRNVVVEVGGSHELEVVAPDPSEQGTLVLQTALDDKAFRGLPFGEITSPAGGRAYTVQATPEPGQDQGESYPQLDNGIEQVGVRFGVEVTQTLDQPDSDPLEWQWNLRVDQKGYLVLTPWGIQALSEIDYARRRPADESAFYTNLDPRQSVGYLVVSKTEMLNTPYRLQVPAGDVKVKLTEVYGLADEDVASALVGEELSADQSVWLSTNLRNGSAWAARLFEMEGWTGAETGFTLSQTVPVKPGEKVRFEVASP